MNIPKGHGDYSVNLTIGQMHAFLADDGAQFEVPTMFHAYIGELRGGRIKITTDRDCLSPELIRFDERVFASEKDMLDCAMAFRNRGYQVCVDTETLFQDYR